MNVVIALTQQDIETLKSLPISVSRVLKGAAELLNDTEDVIADDQGVTAGYLLQLEPILNRLFMHAKEALTNDS